MPETEAQKEVKDWFNNADKDVDGRLFTTPMNPGEPQKVVIRMYGQGIGDCFLLAFPRPGDADGENPFYVVIDSGVVQGTSDPEDRMQKIAYALGEATGGTIDLLIVTHQHWDHVNGFLLAEEYWKALTIKDLWLAWTENPEGTAEIRESQDLLRGLKTLQKRQAEVVRTLAGHAARLGLQDSLPELMSRAAFLGAASSGGDSAEPKDNTTEKAMEIIQSLPKNETRYCMPGDVLPLGDTGVRALVLGPPVDYIRLRRRDPGQEGYHWTLGGDPDEVVRQKPAVAPLSIGQWRELSRQALRQDAFGLTEMNALAASVLTQFGAVGTKTLSDTDEETDLAERSFPFDRRYRIPWADAETYGATQGEALWNPTPAGRRRTTVAPEVPDALVAYGDPVSAWRRIDYDWLGMAETLAIAADDLTNNTSLVVAFELPSTTGDEADRRVLLFVGDAQAGNWLSWDDITQWRGIGVEAPTTRPSMDDLLGRTIFYKVGHHGSHNASLKGKGIERMATKSRDLTAFIPVSYPIAHQVWRWCEMPFDPICRDLIERTKGKVYTPLGPVTLTTPAPANTPTAPQDYEQSTLQLPQKTQAKRKDKKTSLEIPERELEGPVPLWIQVRI